ncbi:GNAT family N-acetyltransferase [Alkalihalobacillus sp. CinArs1]|uniref:GNAT family N-acetyltransferase n=1 Tax=Alkalihalobacillus sp. CinArs1 TaxID=2995314 RepID=UPI0022DE4C57|nr:GNAT family N-acetyltransferase [Alkalihalobacillus sp. CinArs1]
MIRYLTYSDYGQLKGMKTNIQDDYIVRIFPRLVENDSLVGYFEDDRLVGIAGLTTFENEIGILGRLRTDVDFRGRGIASSLMKTLMESAYSSSSIKWIGYATEKSNLPANQLSKKLNMMLTSTVVSARIRAGVIRGKVDSISFNKFQNPITKRSALSNSFQDSRFSFFPYEIYYPLPYIPVLSDVYIEKIELYSSEAGDFFLSREEKGDSYLHLKLFNPTLLNSKAMWTIVNNIASEEDRRIWIDLPLEHDHLLNKTFEKTFWHLIGQGRETRT